MAGKRDANEFFFNGNLKKIALSFIFASMSVKFKKYPHFHITAISMIRFLTIWFVLCTWLAPVTEHAQAQDIKKLLFGLIVSAYTFDSIEDGIQVPITVSADHNNGS